MYLQPTDIFLSNFETVMDGFLSAIFAKLLTLKFNFCNSYSTLTIMLHTFSNFYLENSNYLDLWMKNQQLTQTIFPGKSDILVKIFLRHFIFYNVTCFEPPCMSCLYLLIITIIHCKERLTNCLFGAIIIQCALM